MLHLPDVAQLVHDEVVGRVGLAHEDRLVERVPVEATKPRQPEEPRDVEQPHVPDADRSRVQVEPVEPRLRADDPRVRHFALIAAVSTRIAVPSPGRVW
jgi:hypothetical protein